MARKPLRTVSLLLCLVSATMALKSEDSGPSESIMQKAANNLGLKVDVDAIVDSAQAPTETLSIQPADKKETAVDTVVDEVGTPDQEFVEADSKSQAEARSKSKSKNKSKSKSKSKSKEGFFFFSNFFCDSSRRRRANEDPRRGDPDCSGFDCRRGLSRRRRSDDCAGEVDSCFPTTTLIETETRGAVGVNEIFLGERVLTSEGYSEVLFFAMRNPIAHAQCWKITTDNSTLVLTHSHALFREDGSAVQVAHVDVGDSILSAGVVISLRQVKCTGLVAPVTRAGTIIVNGVITSDYGPMAHLLGHRTIHALAMPLRAMQWAFPQWSFWHSNNIDGRHSIMVLGQSLLSMFSQA